MVDEEKKEEESAAPVAEGGGEQREKKRKSLDALYAEAREEFDLDMSPVESALKTLREGREIQKLSVVRNLAELIEGEPEEAMAKVLPLIQELLAVEPSNLDMHCEAAVVYKNCIKESKLARVCPGLPDRLLSSILENIEGQKENVTAAAWLESLVDIADSVSTQSVTTMIVPLAISQADSGKRVQRRVISTRLIEKLASLVPREIVQKELSPCAQMLCQDPSSAVRTSIAQRLSVLAQSLNNSTDCSALLLPCIIELCKDEDPAVREAILGQMAVCLSHFSKDAKKSVLLPLLRKCSDQALILRDVSLSVVSRHLGSWLQCLRDILSASDLRWWLDTYVRILDFAWQQNDHPEKQQQQSATAENAGTATATANTAAKSGTQQLCVACRRMCAYNFPCFVSVFGDNPEVFTERLLPLLERFCRDPDDEVRSTIASGFHEIVAQRKDAKTAAANQQPLLLGPFVELLSSGTSDVIQQLTANLHLILPILYKEICAGGKKRTNVIMTKLDRILVSCNGLLRGSGSWRAHEAYLNGIAVLRQLVRPRDLMSSFVPLLKTEVLTVRALPCRVAAAQTLLLMMRQLPLSRDREAIIDFFAKDIGQHSSCYRRRLLLDIVPVLLQHFSREFFIQKFLGSVLKMSTDPVSNIRIQLCRTLPKIKQYLVFPNNDESLSSLERVVRELLTSERNTLSRQLIQQSACGLSRAETDPRESRANKTKLAEEKKLWTEQQEEEDEAAEEEAKTDEQRTPGSPESGIFFEEDWTGPKKGQGGLTRSATTANIPEMESQPMTGLLPSHSSDTISAMAIEASSAGPSAGARRRPPAPPSWRTGSSAPKLAIVRPQPQVTVTQRSCSPMPPGVEDRKEGTPAPQESFDHERQSAKKSKLPLSTARYRSATGSTNPASHSPQSASPSAGSANSAAVSEPVKLKKYRPKEVPATQVPATIAPKKTPPKPPPKPPKAAMMSRSASEVPVARVPSEEEVPVPLQPSASSSSVGSGRGGRRPYGLMRVQSTSSAVEKKPAQMSIRVISMS